MLPAPTEGFHRTFRAERDNDNLRIVSLKPPAIADSIWNASSVVTPTALWLSLCYTSALETLHARGSRRSPSDSLISYPVARRTTKLTQLMPCDRSSVRDRRGDCQRLLPPARRDARNAVLREPDSALLPGPSPRRFSTPLTRRWSWLRSVMCARRRIRQNNKMTWPVNAGDPLPLSLPLAYLARS